MGQHQRQACAVVVESLGVVYFLSEHKCERGSGKVSDLVTTRAAAISDCGQYRYQLTRRWGEISNPSVVYIMLNPSTADGETDDATIRVCIGRAQRMGYGGITVLNLFAYRATKPTDLLLAADPIGPHNDYHIGETLKHRPIVIAAWGVGGNHLNRARKVANMCHAFGVTLSCLGVTKEGAPRHPLRISYDVLLKPWIRK